ncbi:CHAD domain-containing protein ['Paenibacillus yunnanensis' Narsing Rao et al. 2020]|uniref:CHAD domain-containing protein n=1 Tax=Paenibacillus tengchongensis TaxID=2608684 RepID=UPI00124CD6AA|nr:CHAD domain-containing protein [Paenibacillus tengchongensis]
MTIQVPARERPPGKHSRQWEDALSKHYDDFISYSQEALQSFDDEAVHQARVNSRKLLTLLSILDPGHTAAGELYAIFKTAQKRLGKVRDADVLIHSFNKRRKKAKAEGAGKTVRLLKAVIKFQKAKRKKFRRKLAAELPELAGERLEQHWQRFISKQLESLVAKRDPNVIMRELEVAFEQQKKHCKTLFKNPQTPPKEAFEALHELRIAAKELRYTAGAAEFALDQKFHAHESIYKEIQEQLGEINDKRVWLETLQAIGREELDVGKKTWNAFTESLRQEVQEALQNNEVIPVADSAQVMARS